MQIDQKFTVSAQNQTAEDLLKDLHKNKLWFYTQWLLFVTKSSNWGPKINKTEIRNFKVKNWCKVFIDVRILCGVKLWYFTSRMPIIEISKIYSHWGEDNTET